MTTQHRIHAALRSNQRPSGKPRLIAVYPSLRLRHQYHHSAIQPLIYHLGTHLPHFTSQPHLINLLNHPADFYSQLLALFRNAQNRIFIASLYIGKEETRLIDALKDELKRKKTLKLIILVDYLRSTREYPKTDDCSAKLLSNLKDEFPDRVDIRLFHTPELFGALKKIVPRRFDEAFGLQHMKIYGADHDLIMSGANLSHDYFTNRQDRYIKLTDQPELSNYLHELIELTGSISYQLCQTNKDDDGNEKIKIDWPRDNAASCEPNQNKKSSNQFKSEAHLLYQNFIKKWRNKSSQRLHQIQPLHHVTIFPIFQLSPFQIYHETDLMIPNLIDLIHQLSSIPSSSSEKKPLVFERKKFILNWTSGYFSLLRDYKKQILFSDSRIQIITASPEANGFYKSKGISKLIPSAYLYLEQLFHKEIDKFNKFHHQIQIRQWKRLGWTYHAKGIWINEINQSNQIDKNNNQQEKLEDDDEEGRTTKEEWTKQEEKCLITSIGSSNYGRRSAERDLECNLLIFLNHHRHDNVKILIEEKNDQTEKNLNKLSNVLVHEFHSLLSFASPNNSLVQNHRISLFVKLFTRLIRNML